MIVSNFENNINFYIDINLSFFEGDKTEQPTASKKEKARSEGQVALSKEVATAIIFIASFLALKVFAGYLYEGSIEIFYKNLTLIESIDDIFNINYINNLILFVMQRIFIICLPIFAVCLFFGLIVNLIQVGWKPSSKLLKPKLSAFNPVNGFKRIISVRSLVEFVKSLLKLAIVSIAIYSCLKDEVYQIQSLMFMDLFQGLLYIGNVCVNLGIKVGIYFILVAVLDYAYTRYSHNKKLKMTKQEVKDEHKMSEGDPQIKGKIRQKMREVSMRRMMQEIPNADVVITNPTHYAVALKYDNLTSRAPIVVAKGVDHLARRIKEIAKENNVEIVENRPLARTLYSTVDIGKEIPPELYQAVAEVLAFVYKLKNAV